MKKILVITLAAMMMVSGLVACEAKGETSRVVAQNTSDVSAVKAKVLVNISGEIVEVEESRVKLDNGMWVLIDEETVFGDDPDNGVEAVDATMLVGNHIQGYTDEDVEANKEVKAKRIYSNRKPSKPMGKVAVNISGEIVEVKEDRVKLDNGMWVIITEDTDFSDDPDNGSQAVNDALVVGNYIVGYTFDDVSSEVVTAYSIYSNGPRN